MKRVYKYATGQDIPDEAIYLWSTVENEAYPLGAARRFVWHYFLVDIKDNRKEIDISNDPGWERRKNEDRKI